MKKKILIIDDEEDFCILLKSFFSEKEAEIQVAYTLADGLQRVAEFKPDMIFLDNNLPDGLGWQAVANLLNEYPTVELNLLSAHENKDFTHLTNYPVKFWEKPINPDELNSYVYLTMLPKSPDIPLYPGIDVE